MRQVFLDRGMAVVKEVSEPLLDDYSVLVAVRYSCMTPRTDVHLKSQRSLLENMPHKVKKLLESVARHGVDSTASLVKNKLQGDVQAFGSSCAGVVVAVGAHVKQVQIGDLVACAGVGFSYHAEMVCVPEHLTVRVSKHDSLRYASMAAVSLGALHGIHRAQLQLGEVVGVFGLDFMGQIVAQCAQRSGAVVVACDTSLERRQIARKCGITHVIAPDGELGNRINFFTNHYGLDAAFIASSASEYINFVAPAVRRGGRVVVYGATVDALNYAPFYDKEITVCSPSYGTSWQAGTDYPYELMRWNERRRLQLFVDLVERNQLVLEPLVTHESTLDAVDTAYEAVEKQHALAAVISYPDRSEYLFKPAKITSMMPSQPSTTKFIPAQKDILRVAVVGASEIVHSRILPLMSSIDRVRITTIVDTDVAKSLTVARQYNAAHTPTHETDIVTHDLADVVIIASPHMYHTEHALHALMGGKAVFVEKPCAVNREQLDSLVQFLQKNPELPFCVDYSRTFSPFMQKIKKAVAKRSTPLVVNYRMNVGFVPQEKWVHRDMSSGRIIGEACYVINLFCHLVDAMPLSVSVEAMHTDDPTLFPTDNFTANIRFRDGSLCSLVYTSIGHTKLGKERMELFFDSKSIVMDDFEYLAGNGFRRSFDETVAVPDKGYQILINTFMDQLMRDAYRPLIPVERLYVGTLLTLSIDKLACQGGGSQEFSL